MPEQAAAITSELIRPFEPFHGTVLPIGTKCQIVGEEDDRNIVKFPDSVGFSGSYHIKKSYVK